MNTSTSTQAQAPAVAASQMLAFYPAQLEESYTKSLDELQQAVLKTLELDADYAYLKWQDEDEYTTIACGPKRNYTITWHNGPGGKTAHLTSNNDFLNESRSHGAYKELQTAKLIAQRHNDLVNTIAMVDVADYLIEKAFSHLR